MTIKIDLPQVGESVTEGVIGRWLKKPGDFVEKFDPLVEVITDKVNMEVPSPYTGKLIAILAKEGDIVPMGQPIAEMEIEGLSDDEPKKFTPDEDSKRRIGTLIHSPYPMGPTGTSNLDTSIVKEDVPKTQRHSPAVTRLAKKHNINLSKVKGTGLGGRITRQDVFNQTSFSEQASTFKPSTKTEPLNVNVEDQIVELTPVRRMIAESMSKSATTIPQVWSILEVDVTNLVKLRDSLKEAFQEKEGFVLTYLPFFVSTVAQCLKNHPLLNSTWNNHNIVLKKNINIAIAVAAPHGLMVPVIKDANHISITKIARKISELIVKGKNGQLTIHDVQGGTFTVNNTGALGSVASQPLINPPQAAILTTEAIIKRPVIINDAIAIRSIMNITLTFDHRIMDGQEAGAFIIDLKNRLELIDSTTKINSAP